MKLDKLTLKVRDDARSKERLKPTSASVPDGGIPSSNTCIQCKSLSERMFVYSHDWVPQCELRGKTFYTIACK